jgi:hypothetical protein
LNAVKELLKSETDEDKNENIPGIRDNASTFVGIFKRDLAIDSLQQAALHALGYFWFVSKVLSRVEEKQSKDLVAMLIRIIQTSTNKSVVNLAVWCFYSQKLPANTFLPKYAEQLLESIASLLSGERGPTFQNSSTVELQCLMVKMNDRGKEKE